MNAYVECTDYSTLALKGLFSNLLRQYFCPFHIRSKILGMSHCSWILCCFRHLFLLQFKKLKQVKPQNCYQSCEIKAYFGGKLWFCLFCFLIKPIKKDHFSYFPTLVQPTHYFSRQVSAAASLTVKSDQIICKNTCSEGVGIHDMQLLRYASTFRRQLVIAARHFGLAGCRTRIKLNRLPKDLLINFLQD